MASKRLLLGVRPRPEIDKIMEKYNADREYRNSVRFPEDLLAYILSVQPCVYATYDTTVIRMWYNLETGKNVRENVDEIIQIGRTYGDSVSDLDEKFFSPNLLYGPGLYELFTEYDQTYIGTEYCYEDSVRLYEESDRLKNLFINNQNQSNNVKDSKDSTNDDSEPLQLHPNSNEEGGSACNPNSKNADFSSNLNGEYLRKQDAILRVRRGIKIIEIAGTTMPGLY